MEAELLNKLLNEKIIFNFLCLLVPGIIGLGAYFKVKNEQKKYNAEIRKRERENSRKIYNNLREAQKNSKIFK